jgi:hypothetical protein
VCHVHFLLGLLLYWPEWESHARLWSGQANCQMKGNGADDML